jgi:hypothetical protein
MKKLNEQSNTELAYLQAFDEEVEELVAGQEEEKFDKDFEQGLKKVQTDLEDLTQRQKDRAALLAKQKGQGQGQKPSAKQQVVKKIDMSKAKKVGDKTVVQAQIEIPDAGVDEEEENSRSYK